jgi:hypothetical protein
VKHCRVVTRYCLNIHYSEADLHGIKANSCWILNRRTYAGYYLPLLYQTWEYFEVDSRFEKSELASQQFITLLLL